MQQKSKVNPKDIRVANDLNQTEFWDKVGITQSGGSRYESGDRKMPPSLGEILRMTYIEHIDLKNVTRDRIEVAMMLQKEQPDVYEALLKECKMRRKTSR